jgi:TRAP-type transport system periplasmic protein
LSGAAWAQQVTLKLHHFLGATTSTQKNFLEPWVQKVQAASGNRIKIDIYPAMQLGGTPPQLIDQVRDGVVDLAWTLPSYTAGRFPRTETFELPFVTGDAVTVNKALVEFYRSNLADEYAPYRVLLLHAHKGQVLHMRDRHAAARGAGRRRLSVAAAGGFAAPVARRGGRDHGAVRGHAVL